jgi:multidrug efflux system membrane fusion protein
MNYQDKSTAAETPATGLTAPTAISPERMRKAMIIGGSAILGVIALLVGFKVFTNQMMKSFFASNTPPPVSVNFETVTQGAVAQTLSAIGSISAIHQVTLAPEISGQVVRFDFIPGGPVKKGEVVAQLNDASEQADLAAARAQQKLSGLTLKRTQDLFAKGAVSQAQLDQAQSQYDAATAEAARAEALVAKKRVRAPFDGVLGVRQTEVGHYLEAGKPVARLTNMAELYAEFTVPEQARPQLSLRQTVDLTVDAYPGKVFKAVVAVIDPQINTATRTIKIQAVADNSEGLLMPGMFANVAVNLPAGPDKVSIPETALDYSLYGNSVYVIEEAGKDAKGQPILKAKRTTVQTGPIVAGRIVIESGLKAGERIVTTGLSKLFDGAHLALNATPTLVKPTELPVP